MNDPRVSRRRLFGLSLGGAAGLAVSALEARAGQPTPPQTEGPFHPFRRQRGADGQVVEVDQRLLQELDSDADLTYVESVSDGRGMNRARGQVLYVVGSVDDTDGQPLEGALVEVWQACCSGRIVSAARDVGAGDQGLEAGAKVCSYALALEAVR